MPPYISIRDRRIGAGEPVYLVAEISANHHGEFEQAAGLVRAAREAGADAVKLQTYTPDSMTIACDDDIFRIGSGTPWEGKNLYRLYEEAYTPWEWHRDLKELAESLGLDLFSTPFDPRAVDFLEELGVPAYKIASFEITDMALLRRAGETGKPVILSTGMASLAEIGDAVREIRETGNTRIALLKCTSAYPAPVGEMNLRTIPNLSEVFQVPVGLSDHSQGTAVPVAAVALGASIIEKHFTLSREIPGPDSSFSLEPHEFRAMAMAVREAEKALGTVSYRVSEHEAPSRMYRRSLFVVKDMRAGEPFTDENTRSIRPGHGMPPKFLKEVLGRRAAVDIKRGTPLQWDLVGT
jgi:pseudaminic acid synthase